jgi:hypothetical protein
VKPIGVTADSTNNIYVADFNLHQIFRISTTGIITTGTVTTFAGAGAQGSTDGTALAATFKYPISVAADFNDGSLYVIEVDKKFIRQINSAKQVSKIDINGVTIIAIACVLFFIFLFFFMFVLSEIEDIVRVSPTNFQYARNDAIEDEINLKYSYKVLHNVGFCLKLFDIQSISSAIVHICQDGSYQCKGIFN